VVACICVSALGAENVHLVSMPFDEIDAKTFNARSSVLADQLGSHHHIISIGAASKPVEESLQKAFPGLDLQKLTLANIRPRVRMNVLYSISGELGYTENKRVRVMGTGHLSEDIIGYDTKGGDALCDIFILSDLVKSEVYQLADHYNVPSKITQAKPSAGLYPGQTDEEELGYTYDALEAPSLALFALLKSGVAMDEISSKREEFKGMKPEEVSFVIERYRANAHKHQAPTTVDSRDPAWIK